MPESVYLRFTPPDRQSLTKLLIYEAASADGPWGTPIEVVTEIGSYPDYISEYTTNDAVSRINWFAIQWEDAGGARTELSNPIQGGSSTFVGEIVSLVGERDHSLDEQVVRQEAEVAIEDYFGIDPYTVNAVNVNYRTKVGLAKLVQARSMLNNLILAASVGSSSGWTAGLVSMKSGTSEGSKASEALIRWLLSEAAGALRLNFSRIARMATPVIAGGMSEIVTADISRLMIEVE